MSIFHSTQRLLARASPPTQALRSYSSPFRFSFSLLNKPSYLRAPSFSSSFSSSFYFNTFQCATFTSGGEMSAASQIDTLLSLWFPKGATPEENSKRWFVSNEELDNHLKTVYQPMLEEIEKDETSFSSWCDSDRGRLAYVILTDQFPRNIYRRKKKAFAFDHLSVAVSLSLVDRVRAEIEALKAKKASTVSTLVDIYTPAELNFLFMPLMHAEDDKIGKVSVEVFGLFNELHKTKGSKGSYDFAVKHYKILEQFGRYPHRNKVMARESTKEEVEFLKSAETFGQ